MNPFRWFKVRYKLWKWEKTRDYTMNQTWIEMAIHMVKQGAHIKTDGYGVGIYLDVGHSSSILEPQKTAEAIVDLGLTLETGKIKADLLKFAVDSGMYRVIKRHVSILSDEYIDCVVNVLGDRSVEHIREHGL